MGKQVEANLLMQEAIKFRKRKLHRIPTQKKKNFEFILAIKHARTFSPAVLSADHLDTF